MKMPPWAVGAPGEPLRPRPRVERLQGVLLAEGLDAVGRQALQYVAPCQVVRSGPSAVYHLERIEKKDELLQMGSRKLSRLYGIGRMGD